MRALPNFRLVTGRSRLAQLTSRTLAPSRIAKQGGWAKFEFTASVDAICNVSYVLSDRSAGSGTQVDASAGKVTEDDMYISPSVAPGHGEFTLTCTDMDGNSKMATGTFEVLSASATPTPSAAPTAPPTEAPTEAPTAKPTARPTEAPPAAQTPTPS